jgi:3',5'-cyclic AMP phosphodiesterase CpdA
VRFVFMADMQIGMYATFSGLGEAGVAEYAARDLRVWSVPPVEGFEWDARRYEEAVAVVNALRPELVIIGGDLVDDPNAEDQYDEFMRITHTIDGDIPVRWLPGNHDVAWDTVVPTPESIEAYRSAFGPDYFAFDHGPARFIALNTPVIDHPEHVPGELEAQLGFLEAQLEESVARGLEPIVVGHHPLFLASADEEDSYWNLPTPQRQRILDLAHGHGVRLVLGGHWHRNCIARDGDLEMVTTGPVGYPLGRDPSGLRVVEIANGAVNHRYEPTGHG